jgi:CAAX protease family protein
MEGTTYQPPPALPELPEGVDPMPRWPWWYALAGFGLFFVLTAIAQSILFVATGTDPTATDAVVTVVGTLIMECLAFGTAWLFASLTTRPRVWHFGLRSTRLWPAVGWAAAGMGCFWVFTALYSVLVHPDIEQDVTETLGADQSTLGLIAAGIVIIGVAPIAEEFFFRGFMYRSLRGSLPVLLAALVDGVIFGLIHYQACDQGATSCSAADGLLLVPPLAMLGFVFCIVYERTGSLFTTIALHALNNAIAFGVQADGWAVSAVAGPLMLAGCVFAPARLGNPARPAPVWR